MNHIPNLTEVAMNVIGITHDASTGITDILIAFIAMSPRAFALRVQDNVASAMRTAKGRRVHLLALAHELRRITHLSSHIGRQTGTITVIDHQFAVVRCF